MAIRTGIVVAAASEDRRQGVFLELGCVSEVVQRKPPFIALARETAQKLLALRPQLDVDDACRQLGRKLGETIRLRRCQHVSPSPHESLAAAHGDGIAALVGGTGADVELLDLAARAVVERRTHRGWRDEFAAVPPHLDWMAATILLAARHDDALAVLLPRDDAGLIAIDGDALLRLQRDFHQRLTLTRCAIYDLSEDDRDSEPLDHSDAINLRRTG